MGDEVQEVQVDLRRPTTVVGRAVRGLVVLLLAVAGLLAAAAPATAGPSLLRVSPGTQNKMAGTAVPDLAPAVAEREMKAFRADGGNTISLFVWWVTAGPTSDTITRYAGTQSDASLGAEIGQARRDGLAVVLTPVFYCRSCQGGWRGVVKPADVDAFFASYRAFVDHYAALAQSVGVSTFYAGSEMTTLEGQTQQWEQVISDVRRRFHGQVAYEENWDVLGQAHFLSQLDVIGVSAYFPLDDAPEPNLSRLLSDWTSSRASSERGRNWVSELAGLAQSTQKPIEFGEAGYMSGDFAARQPFLNFQGQADWLLQSDLYQALLETFSGFSWWKGVIWWEWFAPTGSAADNTRTPQGKTAESLLRSWYADGLRPARPDQSLPLLTGQEQPTTAVAHIQSVSSAVTVPGVVAAPASAVSSPGALDPVQEASLVALAALVLALGGAAWAVLGRPSG
jgi:hypothetical protein